MTAPDHPGAEFDLGLGWSWSPGSEARVGALIKTRHNETLRFPCRSKDDLCLARQAGPGTLEAALRGAEQATAQGASLRAVFWTIIRALAVDLVPPLLPHDPRSQIFLVLSVASPSEESLLIAVLAPDATQAGLLARAALNLAPDAILFVEPAPGIIRLKRLRLSAEELAGVAPAIPAEPMPDASGSSFLCPQNGDKSSDGR